MKTVLKMENITKEFVEPRKNILALNKINFELNEGQCIGLLGPSGSGKTTLLQIAALLDNPTAGEITINNEVVATSNYLVPPERRGVGMVFQDYALFPHLTVEQNVAFVIDLKEKK